MLSSFLRRIEMDAEKIVNEMTLEEKAALTVGASFWYFEGVERLSVPRTLVTDGPHGIRKQKDLDSLMGSGESVEATCFPPSCLSASSWNPSLIEEEGASIANEALSEGVSIVLGPGVNSVKGISSITPKIRSLLEQ